MISRIDPTVEEGIYLLTSQSVHRDCGMSGLGLGYIDLGPEGGDRGGEVVASGTPEEVASHTASHTGGYLRDVLTQ